MIKFKRILAVLALFACIFVSSCSCQEDDPDTPSAEQVCQHVCPQCKLCKDQYCEDNVCSQKCQCNGHTCKHSCPLCVKCTDETCTNAKCKAKCQGHTDYVDVAGILHLDLNSNTKKLMNAQVRVVSGTVIGYIDGDTTHFNCDSSINEDCVLKARYLGVNTKESTGRIEPFGKKASNYTKNALSTAESIVVESNDENWNTDSTGNRYLVWIWYRPTATDEYRCLNIELLQRGLGIITDSSGTKYESYCVQANQIAEQKKYNIYSGMDDPDFYYGDVISVTLKELKVNPDPYVGVLISVEGIVAYKVNTTMYLESYDEETNLYLGLQVYLGTSPSSQLLKICKMGNKVKMVGTLAAPESGRTYQLSGVQVDPYASTKKEKAKNSSLISTKNSSSYQVITVNEFKNGKKDVTYFDSDGNEQTKSLNVSDLITSATVKIENVRCVHCYTTTSGTSAGAMTLTCKDTADNSISIRTDKLEKSDSSIAVESDFLYKNFTATGIVDYFNGAQVKICSYNSVTFIN